jgi:hypothetical protein
VFTPAPCLRAERGRPFQIVRCPFTAQVVLRSEGLQELSGRRLALGQTLEERGSPHTLP